MNYEIIIKEHKEDGRELCRLYAPEFFNDDEIGNEIRNMFKILTNDTAESQEDIEDKEAMEFSRQADEDKDKNFQEQNMPSN